MEAVMHECVMEVWQHVNSRVNEQQNTERVFLPSISKVHYSLFFMQVILLMAGFGFLRACQSFLIVKTR